MSSNNTDTTANPDSIELFPSLTTSSNTNTNNNAQKSNTTPLIQSHIPELLPSANMCETCKVEKYKYKCPACQFKSCSLKCIKLHKEKLNCTGERDPTKFVKKKQYSELNLTEGNL
jgi:hypothetical protein